MIRLPVSQHQLVWLFRCMLLVLFVMVMWLALASIHLSALEAFTFSDKVNHAFAFFVLSYCIDNAFPRVRFLLVKIWPLLAYGIAIELFQRLVQRDSSILDVVADCVGIFLYWVLRPRLRQLVGGRQPVSIK